MRRAAVEAELLARAEKHLPQSRLLVDYYRIRRRLAPPLPIRGLFLAGTPLPGEWGRYSYPWPIWMIWALEERIAALGWAGEWTGEARFRSVAGRDLQALAGWPTFHQYEHPDLTLGHAARILWNALTHWSWLDPAVRQAIAEGGQRLITAALPLVEACYGRLASREALAARGDASYTLRNIPLIGTLGTAALARALGHPATARLDERLGLLWGALLDIRAKGFSEGVAYDGYVLDFVLPWMAALPASQQAAFLDHPRFDDAFQEALFASAPGDPAAVPEIGDVEPIEMPFHITAQARTCLLRPDPLRRWYLERCPLARIPADGLALLRQLPEAPEARGPAPGPGAYDAHYLTVLRSGWEAADLSVCLASTTSAMGHLQAENGTLVIGTRGQWLLSDPGYQQYLPTSERDFTSGPASRNMPLLNGVCQTQKLFSRPVLETLPDGARTVLDLTASYPRPLGLERLVRSVWLLGNRLVVVADRIQGAGLERIAYHWHGHPRAGWWVEEQWAEIYLAEEAAGLSFASPQARITDQDFGRQRGSRGHLTLRALADGRAPAVWWIFAAGGPRPEYALSEDGLALRIAGRTLTAAPESAQRDLPAKNPC